MIAADSIFDVATMRDAIRIAGLPEPNRENCVSCPISGEKTPSLHFTGERGRESTFRCFSCCAGGGIGAFLVHVGVAADFAHAAKVLEEHLGVDRLGTAPRSVPSALVAAKPPKKFATVELLAAHKHLDLDVLRKLGLEDVDPERARELGVVLDGPGVLIPYPSFGGVRIRSRVRQFLGTSHPSKWTNDGAACGAYGSEKTIAAARKRGSLTIVEGESDCWALWSHKIASLGIPGASMTKYVEAGHVENISLIYVVREPGGAGEKFPSALAKRLHDLGWTGELRVVDLQAAHGCKDPSDLHCDNPERFVERWKAAAESALLYVPAPAAEPSEPPKWEPAYPWPALDTAALHGLAGDTIRAIAPQTEADAAAMLFTLLAQVGNVLGPDAYACVGDEHHPGRLFVAIVGDTAAGAKGTSAAAIRPIVRAAFPEWFESRQFAGFGSGEAIVAEYVDEATDRRGFILEPEFARILTVASRDGSTLSPILRQAWDGSTLACRRAKDRVVARGVHLSAVAHVTPTELRAKLAEGDMLNGFANRFLFVASRRSRKLPSGGYVDPAVIGQLAKRLSSVIRPMHKVCARSPEAETLWAKMYLAEPDRDGTVGALTARAHAQRLRLSVIYAALDGATVIRPEHLRAADACWRYAVQSVEHIFGGLRGDRVQDQLLAALRNAWPEGLTGADQAGIFAKSLRPGQIAEARAELERRRLIRTESRPSPSAKGGRPTVRTYAIPRPNQPNQPLALEVNSVDSVDSAPENGIEDELDTYAVPRSGQTEHAPVLDVDSVDSAPVEHEDTLPSEVRV